MLINSKTILAATYFMCAIWQAIGKPDEGSGFMQHLKETIPQPKIDKCLEEAGLTEEDLLKATKNKGEPSDKELCLVKCFGLASGTINTDGTFNKEKAMLTIMPKFQTPEVMSCLENTGTVSTCEDMKKVMNCFSKAAHNSK